MTWQGTKTDWGTDDGVDNKDFNRIEGNTLDNRERLNGHDSDIANHDSRISSNDSDISSINSTLSSHNSRISSNDNRLDNIKWVSGRYRGNDANDRFIPVGFTPDIVLLNRGTDGYGHTNYTTSVTVIFTTVHDTINCIITSNGFSVSGSVANNSEWYYQWIAIKL